MFHYQAWRTLVPVLLLVYCGNSAFSQMDPGAREDAQIERQKILRAADQIEVINDQHNKMVEEIEKLKQQIKSFSDENAALSRRIAESQTQAGKEKEALLDQVSKLLADQEKRLSEKISAVEKSGSEQKAKPAPPKKVTPTTTKEEEGYEHIVKPGQTLWSIAKAYQDQGVKASVEDIRKANNLKDGQALRMGQKLFIPGK